MSYVGKTKLLFVGVHKNSPSGFLTV